MRKILYGLSIIVAVTAVVVGATTAFYNDEETSSGNVLVAGSIDLGIDNTSYYNGVLNPGTSWTLDYDIEDEVLGAIGQVLELPRVFFNFLDLKPGDYGEDTISLHVKDNDSWLCADVTLTSNDDVTCTEPEQDAEVGQCQEPGVGLGDLAQDINFLWWADDGDNVLEEGERPLPGGPLGALGVEDVDGDPDLTAYVTLADSSNNIWSGLPNDPVDPFLPNSEDEDIRYIGKAFCFGAIQPQALPDVDTDPNRSPAGQNDGDLNNTPGQPTDGGFTCSGQNAGNESQTDSATLSITFRAEQSRHLPNFSCQPQPNGTND